MVAGGVGDAGFGGGGVGGVVGECGGGGECCASRECVPGDGGWDERAVPSRSWKVVLVIVAGSRASLKVAVTVVPVSDAGAPAAGVTSVIVGGVVSGGALVVKTTSTQ